MVTLPAKVTASEALATRDSLLNALGRESDATTVVDASALQQFDSSVLAVLLACRRGAIDAGRAFRVQGMPAKLASLTTLYGIGGLWAPDTPMAASDAASGSTMPV